MNTKERILKEALALFSQKGFKAVTVDDIARRVGIKAPSLYKHYKGKSEIISALLNKSMSRYKEFISTILVSPTSPPTPKELRDKVTSLLEYSLHDEYVAPLRKIMTIGQFSTKEFGDMYSDLYVNMMLDYHTELFSKMINNGTISNGNARELALIYDSPFFILLGECDRHPEKEEEAKIELRNHVEFFFSMFSPKTKLEKV